MTTFPLTPLQHAMVAAWLRDRRAGTNVEQWLVTLREAVDASALRRAWETVVARYAVLRTSIDLTEPATPRLQPHAQVSQAWSELDWRGLTSDALAERLQRWLADDRRRGLDLAAPPLWRVALVRTADAEYRFIVTYHHVLLDGRSLVLLGRELFARYDAGRGVATSSIDDSPEVSFAQFVAAADRRDRSASAEYWRKELNDRPPLSLPLPIGPTSQSAAAFDVSETHEALVTLSAAETKSLVATAAAHGVTPHNLVQAAWALTLAAHTGVDDHTFGSVRACRKACAGAERMIGILINTLPIRVNVDWSQTAVELWRTLRDRQLALRDHELCGPAEIAAAIDGGERRLWSTILMYTDRPVEAMLDVAGRPHPTRSVELHERSDAPLTLVASLGQGLSLKLEYATANYTDADARRLLATVRRLLLSFHAGADARLADLPLVDEADRERLLAWGRGPAVAVEHASIVERFSAQAARAPHAAAIRNGGDDVSYCELTERVAQAADALTFRGVRAGDRVCLALNRSPDWVALILAVWRLRAVYVPLDPQYPAERRRTILADARPTLLVVDEPAAWPCAEVTSVGVVQLFAAPRVIAAETEKTPVPFSGDEPAVILYTSGSTGRPKGVVLTHGNLIGQNEAATRAMRYTAVDRTTTVSSPSFDAALEEVFAPLCVGATLVLPPAEVFDSLESFVELIERERLSVVDLPTSLWRELTNYLYEAGRKLPPCVRAIMTGGERATATTYRRFLDVGGDRVHWFNAYGPTEATICATLHEHDPQADADAHAPPIGRPLDNVSVFVVDRCGRLALPGVPGELLISGPGLALGYWNDSERTHERFITPPHSSLPVERCYRTGDIVRWRDGVLEYVGRLDAQVKLRGFRIEPGEVEAALTQFPVVRDAAVAVRRSPAGTEMLVAYVVPLHSEVFDADALRTIVAAKLPGYMVPGRFVVLDALPLSPNGKVAIDQLPEPFTVLDAGDDTVRDRPTRAADELEAQILAVWQATLGLPQARLDDDFFDLGGDSLKAMTLAAKLEAELQTKLPANLVHRARTPGAIAAELRAGAGDADLAPLVVLREGEPDRPLFLIHSLGGDAWIYRDMVAELQTDSRVYGLQIPGLDGRGTPPANVADSAADFIARVRAVQPVGPYRLAGYSSGGLIALEMAKQLTADEYEVEFLGLIDSGLPTLVEANLAPRRGSRCVGLLRSAPALARELLALDWPQRRRRVVGFLRRLVQRCVPSSQAEAEELNDREMRECFAEDISIFSPARLQLIREHFLAVERYAPTPYAGAAHLFRSTRQPVFGTQSPTLGWEHLVRGGLEVTSVVGAHATLMKRPHAGELARAIDAALEQIELLAPSASEGISRCPDATVNPLACARG